MKMKTMSVCVDIHVSHMCSVHTQLKKMFSKLKKMFSKFIMRNQQDVTISIRRCFDCCDSFIGNLCGENGSRSNPWVLRAADLFPTTKRQIPTFREHFFGIVFDCDILYFVEFIIFVYLISSKFWFYEFDGMAADLGVLPKLVIRNSRNINLHVKPSKQINNAELNILSKNISKFSTSLNFQKCTIVLASANWQWPKSHLLAWPNAKTVYPESNCQSFSF